MPSSDRSTRVITLVRLAALLDAYGAEPARWPAEERAAAFALLERSPEARRLRDEAARVDALLDRATAADAPTASPALLARVLASVPATAHDEAPPTESRAAEAPARPQAGIRNAARARGDAASRAAARRPVGGTSLRRAMPAWGALAAALPLAAAAAFGLWLLRGADPATRVAQTPTEPAVVATAAAPAKSDALDAMALAELEGYDALTDDLLDLEGLEVVDALPALGCSEGDWGCPELDFPDERSTTDTTRRVLA